MLAACYSMMFSTENAFAQRRVTLHESMLDHTKGSLTKRLTALAHFA